MAGRSATGSISLVAGHGGSIAGSRAFSRMPYWSGHRAGHDAGALRQALVLRTSPGPLGVPERREHPAGRVAVELQARRGIRLQGRHVQGHLLPDVRLADGRADLAVTGTV